MHADSGESGADPAPPREARLRPEYASEYPEIEAGIWIPATVLAMKLVQRTHTRRLASLYTRTFDPRHFEFRGGEAARPAQRLDERTRTNDL